MRPFAALCLAVLTLPAWTEVAADQSMVCAPSDVVCYDLQGAYDETFGNAATLAQANVGWLNLEPGNIRFQPLLELPEQLAYNTLLFSERLAVLLQGAADAASQSTGPVAGEVSTWALGVAGETPGRATSSALTLANAGDAMVVVAVAEGGAWVSFVNAAGVTLASATLSFAQSGPGPVVSTATRAVGGGPDYLNRKVSEAVERLLEFKETPPPEAAQPDVDENSLGDAWEDKVCRSPAASTLPADACETVEGTLHLAMKYANQDFDEDGLGLVDEYRWNVDPLSPDTDRDGLPDGPEADLWRRPESELAVSANLWTCPPSAGAGLRACAWRHPDSFRDEDGDGVANIGQDPAGPLAAFGAGETDSEGDGLGEGDEYYGCHTNPAYGANDHADPEISGFILCAGVTDRGHGSDPAEEDTDGDGLWDAREVCSATGGACSRQASYDTDPQAYDTDGDAWPDGGEAAFWQGNGGWHNDLDSDTILNNLADPDSDRDGIQDGIEHEQLTLRPDRPDTDGDTMPDQWELRNLFDPRVRDGGQMGMDNRCQSPAFDADSDGLCNAFEYGFQKPPEPEWREIRDGEWQSVLNPRQGDMDGDKLSDGKEVFPGTTPYYFSRMAQRPPGSPNTFPDGRYDHGWDETYPGYPGSTRVDAADTDEDTLTDFEEHDTVRYTREDGDRYTNPNAPDSDLDGIDDAIERGTDPTDWDTDDDNVADAVEPPECANASDCDNDGLRDGDEAPCSPRDRDKDGDNLWDADEKAAGSDCNDPDTDGDGLDDLREVRVTLTDPADADSDDDRLSDRQEVEGTPNAWHNARHSLLGDYVYARDRCTSAACASDGATDPMDDDTDGDGLKDGDEVLDSHPSTLCAGGVCVETFTNPNRADTDGDGLDDRIEPLFSCYGGSPYDATNFDMDRDALMDNQDRLQGGDACNRDTDGDFLHDGAEVAFGTKVYNSDSDGDGVTDLVDPDSERENNPPVILSVRGYPILGNFEVGVCIAAADAHDVVVARVEVRYRNQLPVSMGGAWVEDPGAAASAAWTEGDVWTDGGPGGDIPHLCVPFSYDSVEPWVGPVAEFRITLSDVVPAPGKPPAHNEVGLVGHVSEHARNEVDLLQVLEAVTCPMPGVGAATSIVVNTVRQDRIKQALGALELTVDIMEEMKVGGKALEPAWKAFGTGFAILCAADIFQTILMLAQTVLTVAWETEVDEILMDQFTLQGGRPAYIQRDGYADSAPVGQGTVAAGLGWRGEGYRYLQGKYPEVGTPETWHGHLQHALDTGNYLAIHSGGIDVLEVVAMVDGKSWSVFVAYGIIVDIVIWP